MQVFAMVVLLAAVFGVGYWVGWADAYRTQERAKYRERFGNDPR